jgi:hypothetical protein
VKRGGIEMRGLKASIIIASFTVLVCTLMLVTSGGGTGNPLKKDVQTMGSYTSGGIVKEEGSFSPDMYYEYGDGDDIYYVKYDDRSEIKVYNISSGKSEKVLTPINMENKIHAFCKSGDYYVWEEDGVFQEDSEKPQPLGDWKLYIRKGNQIIRIDEGVSTGSEEDRYLLLPPQKLSASGNYLVYKVYGYTSDSDKLQILVMLYDLRNLKASVIFSSPDIKNAEVSEPSVYSGRVVWSVSNGEGKGDMYLYDINSGSTSKLTEKGSLLNPIIWGDYVVCSSIGGDGPAIAVLNFNTGFKKYIAFSDYSLFPKKELHDYTIGGGYVTLKLQFLLLYHNAPIDY